MTNTLKQALIWSPRILLLAYAGFISLFALDAFQHGHGWLENLRDFAIHLIPVFVLLTILALAWWRAWVGAAGSLALMALFLYWNFTVRHNVWSAVLVIAGPLALLAILFAWQWWRRKDLWG